MQGSACLRGAETGLLFPVRAAGIYERDVVFKWQSRTDLSPARVLFGRSPHKMCVSRSCSGGGNNAVCIGGAQRGGQ